MLKNSKTATLLATMTAKLKHSHVAREHVKTATPQGKKMVVLSAFAVFLLSLSTSSAAKGKDWWFEIEVLLFKRDINAEKMPEQFSKQLNYYHYDGAVDLLTPYLHPDVSLLRASLPNCHAEPEPLPSVDELLQSYGQYKAKLALKYAQNEEASTLSLTEYASELEQSIPSKGTTNDDNSDDTVKVTSQHKQQPYNINPLLSDHVTATKKEETQIAFSNEVVFQSDLDAQLKQQAEEASYAILAMGLAQVESIHLPINGLCVTANEKSYWPLAENQQPREFVADVPVNIDGVAFPYADSAYLLPQTELKLKKLYKDIRRKPGLTPLLHAGWRQQVLFGRNKAPYHRLYAGHNFAKNFATNGQLLIEQPESKQEVAKPTTANLELVDRIDLALTQTNIDVVTEAFPDNKNLIAIQQTEALWEIDGLFKVYLQYINRVPYLHIDSSLDYRQAVHTEADPSPTSDDQSGMVKNHDISLQSFEFKQLRRVISKQLHYFDHPFFGMVVQIRRHSRAEEPESNDS